MATACARTQNALFPSLTPLTWQYSCKRGLTHHNSPSSLPRLFRVMHHTTVNYIHRDRLPLCFCNLSDWVWSVWDTQTSLLFTPSPQSSLQVRWRQYILDPPLPQTQAFIASISAEEIQAVNAMPVWRKGKYVLQRHLFLLLGYPYGAINKDAI